MKTMGKMKPRRGLSGMSPKRRSEIGKRGNHKLRKLGKAHNQPPIKPVTRKWDEMGFYDYSCGCVEFQDGWDFNRPDCTRTFVDHLKEIEDGEKD